MTIFEAREYDDCTKIVDFMKDHTPVVVNFENIEEETAIKVLDFLSGAAFALHGRLEEVTQNIYVLLPENVELKRGGK